jgi:hypothetical protein
LAAEAKLAVAVNTANKAIGLRIEAPHALVEPELPF